MKHSSANMKHIKSFQTQKQTPFRPEILADSLEVMEAYCMQKILLLKSSLEKLNVADNAREIIGVCQQIRKEKQQLAQIIARKG